MSLCIMHVQSAARVVKRDFYKCNLVCGEEKHASQSSNEMHKIIVKNQRNIITTLAQYKWNRHDATRQNANELKVSVRTGCSLMLGKFS